MPDTGRVAAMAPVAVANTVAAAVAATMAVEIPETGAVTEETTVVKCRIGTMKFRSSPVGTSRGVSLTA